MIEFMVVMLFITLGIGAVILLLIAVQIGLKRLYERIPNRNKKRLLFVKTIAEADTWQLFGVCIMILLFAYWIMP